MLCCTSGFAQYELRHSISPPWSPSGHAHSSPSKNEGNHLCPLQQYGVWINARLVPTCPHHPFAGVTLRHPSQPCPQGAPSAYQERTCCDQRLLSNTTRKRHTFRPNSSWGQGQAFIGCRCITAVGTQGINLISSSPEFGLYWQPPGPALHLLVLV